MNIVKRENYHTQLEAKYSKHKRSGWKQKRDFYYRRKFTSPSLYTRAAVGYNIL